MNSKALGSVAKSKAKKIEEHAPAEDSDNDLLEALMTIEDQEKKMKTLKAKLEKALSKKGAGSLAVSEGESEGDGSFRSDASISGFRKAGE